MNRHNETWNSAALYVICLSLTISLTTQVHGECKQPAVESLLESSRMALRYNGSYFPLPKAHHLPFDFRGQKFQWFGVGWEGPKSGALFVLDCGGRRVAATRLGYVSKLRKGPVLSPVGPTVEVLYVAGTGTGYIVERVDIFAIQQTTFKSVWSHIARESIFVFPQEDGTEVEYQWRVSENGQQIRIEGKRTVSPKPKAPGGAWGSPTVSNVSPEQFCWDRKYVQYVTCQLR